MNVWSRLRAFLSAHREQERVALSAITLDLLWTTARWFGLFGAGLATAAIFTSSTPYHPQFQLSTKGIAFIERNEGLRLTPYNDPFNCTVGVGHLIHMGACSASDYSRWRLSMAQASALLVQDSQTAQNAVRGDVTFPINQPQFDSLVDFTFNVGTGGLASSQVLRDVNAGAFPSVPASLGHWVTANGRVLGGLVTRRHDEGVLFLTGNYGAGIGVFTPPKPLTTAEKLRLRTGYFAWLSWYLGEAAWKPYGRANVTVRPHVPAKVPKTWWRHEALFVARRSR